MSNNGSIASYSNDSLAVDRSTTHSKNVKIMDDEDESLTSTNTTQQVTKTVNNEKKKRKLKPKPNIWESSLEAIKAAKAATSVVIPSEETSIVASVETSGDDDDKEYLIGVPAKKLLPSISSTPPADIKSYYSTSGTTGNNMNNLYCKDDGINANPVQVNMYTHAQSTGIPSRSSSSVNANIDSINSSSPNVNYSVPFTGPQTATFQNSNMNLSNQNMYHSNSEVFPNYPHDHQNNSNNKGYYPHVNSNYNMPTNMPRQDNYSGVNGGQRLQTAYDLVQFSSQRQYPVTEASQENSNKKFYIDSVDYGNNNIQYSSNNSVNNNNYNHTVTKDSQLNNDNYPRNLYQQNLWTPQSTNLNFNYQN